MKNKKSTEQQLLRGLQTEVEKVTKKTIRYGTEFKSGSWELIFSHASGKGKLPVLYHAEYKP